jgi:hypothetical protein
MERHPRYLGRLARDGLDVYLNDQVDHGRSSRFDEQ